MRYLWNMFHEYRAMTGPLTRLAMTPLTHYLRLWDSVSANRVDRFVANSATVAARIRRYYRRDAGVIWPPVDTEAFAPVSADERGDYLLMVGELVAYKRPELAVEACNRLRKKLVVIGGGELLERIRRLAGSTVTVMGPRPFAELRHHYARCQALLFPGEEDFGIVPVEAMASGRPVIAYGRGGATETVLPGLSGMLFPEQSVEAIIDAVERFRERDFDPDRILAHAAKFSRQRFIGEMKEEFARLLTLGGGSAGGAHDPASIGRAL